MAILELKDAEVTAENVESFALGEGEGGIVGGSRDGVAGDGVAAEVGLGGDVFFAAGHKFPGKRRGVMESPPRRLGATMA